MKRLLNILSNAIIYTILTLSFVYILNIIIVIIFILLGIY